MQTVAQSLVHSEAIWVGNRGLDAADAIVNGVTHTIAARSVAEIDVSGDAAWIVTGGDGIVCAMNESDALALIS